MKVLNLNGLIKTDLELAEEKCKALTELREAIASAQDMRRIQARVNIQVAEADAEVQRLMREMGTKTTFIDYDGQGLKATVVEAERVKINEQLLRENLTDPVWRSLVKEKVDSSKLEDAVAKGYVTVDLLDQVTTVEKNKSYVRYSLVSTEEADEDAG